jgi:glycosyltransferase involved in cell wall biosynthesis
MTNLGKRILLLATGLNRGGAETQVLHLAKGLLLRGWEVEVVSMLSGGDMLDQFRNAGILVHEVGMKRGIPDPRAVVRFRRIILTFHPDIVHSHMIHANLLARMTRLVCPIPALITTAHNITEGGRWTEIAYRVTDPMTDLTTIICTTAAQRYIQVGSVPKNRLRVVVNGVPLDQFLPNPHTRVAARRQLGIGDEFVWLAVGRFESQKDYPNLVDAIRQASSQQDLFLIAGDGPLRSEIEALAGERNVAHRVRFLGMRTDVPALMAAADGYVMSSAWEGLPMVLLEAAASGLPIVATNVGGTGEIVRDGVSGFLVPASNPAALAKALQNMEQQPPSARTAMGSIGRNFVVRNYSLSTVLDQWESIYQSFIHIPTQPAIARACV